MREADVQNAIRIRCGELGLPCFRCNVGRVRTADGRWFDTGLPEGFPDLMILANGTVLFCEVKAKKGRQREAQKAFQARMEELGYRYFVARSVEDLERELRWKRRPNT